MALTTAKFAWLDGEIVRWENAKIHIATECVMRGIGVFEGFRAYWNDKQKQLYAFRLSEHFQRLEASMKVLRLKLPYATNVLERELLEPPPKAAPTPPPLPACSRMTRMRNRHVAT